MSDASTGGVAGGAEHMLVLIASVARNGSIGQGSELVWREPADQRWFRRQTMGCPVVMGRKTWDSLPARFRPLPGRDNIVLTRQRGWTAAGAQLAHTLDDALVLARNAARHSAGTSTGNAERNTRAPRIFVIGGAQLYAQALPLADQLLLTEIDADLPGDSHFPAWPPQQFLEVARETQHSNGPPACAYAFVTYQRQR